MRKTISIIISRLLSIAILVTAQVALSASPAAALYYGSGYNWAHPLLGCDDTDCPRFIILTDWSSQVALDRETGLLWERFPAWNEVNSIQIQISAAEAINHCSNRIVAGRMGWRLPTVEELSSLNDFNRGLTSYLKSQTIFVFCRPSCFPSDLGMYWTRTPVEADTSARVWAMSVSDIYDAPGSNMREVPPDFRYKMGALCVRTFTGVVGPGPNTKPRPAPPRPDRE